MKILSKKEKELWNLAVRKTLNEVYLYDGTIPDEVERGFLVSSVYDKIAYASENPFNRNGQPHSMVIHSHQKTK